LTLISGAVVLVVGASFLFITLKNHQQGHDHGDHHHHHHEHPHPVTSNTLAPTWRGLAALGLAGGIVPSGSALVVLLSSVALGRLGFGLVLIIAFGFGMAVVLVVTGVLLVHAGQFMVRLFPETSRQRLSKFVPLVSASVMTLLGVVSTVQGLTQTGLFGL
jgi:ABC-type nickel/cobalt efflux system permease component RcnA